MKLRIFAVALTAALAPPAIAETSHQPYKGFEAREIASLSSKDIAELRSGAGWGLALPAELNGYPGPAHVLELKKELALSSEQAGEMLAIYDAMNKKAVAAGLALIDAERKLDQGFKSGDLTPGALRDLIAASEAVRAELRYIHLLRHLQSVELLTAEQISTYEKLRGYTSDPCLATPEGHDVELWRHHNGCDG